MTSTFRLTRAEFKKIFKRASVYIMALLLVVAVLVSVYLFKPLTTEDKTINYGADLTVENYYDTFFNKDLANSKKGIDTIFENAENMYNYYSNSSHRELKIEENYNDVILSMNELKSVTDPSLKTVKYNAFKANLQAFYDNFIDFKLLEQYPHIYYSTEFVADGQTSNYYLSTYSKNIQNLLEATKDTTKDADDIIQIYDTNKYENKLLLDKQNAIDYIRPTLYSLALNITNAYNDFNVSYNSGGSSPALENMEKYRKQLLTNVTTFQTYFNKLVDNEDFPIVLINKELKEDISSHIDIAIEALSAPVFNGTTRPMSDYANLKQNLDNNDTANYFTKMFADNTNNISQVRIKAPVTAEFSKVLKKVTTNQETIINNIKEKRTDESIKNIQKSITDYSLLAESYKTYMEDRTKLALSENYRSDVFTKLYGYNLKDFNIYEIQERITKNMYYIDNNIYENSFNQNFSLMQASNTEPNALDFMYFAMEICTVLIIIFAMMMMCNLITSETESGTIKLLLVRPYKRSKIITAKLLATIFFVLIFTLFSALISFAGGYFLYGLDLSNVLVIINSNIPVVMSPIVLMLINILSQILDILFYVLLAMMISIVFKNYAGSISFSFVLILVTYTLNMLFGGAFWYSLLPGPNLHLFKYFGNAFVSVSDSMLLNILITPIQSTMNLWYSLLILASYSLVSIVVSYAVFNKRDF